MVTTCATDFAIDKAAFLHELCNRDCHSCEAAGRCEAAFKGDDQSEVRDEIDQYCDDDCSECPSRGYCEYAEC